jgi:hypothetical protein
MNNELCIGLPALWHKPHLILTTPWSEVFLLKMIIKYHVRIYMYVSKMISQIHVFTLYWDGDGNSYTTLS